MGSRPKIEKSSAYCNKVLIGTWVDSRHNGESYKPENSECISIYQESFTPQGRTKIGPEVLWDKRLNSEKSNFVPDPINKYASGFFQNFSSTYDLSYNHFPKCLDTQIPRRFRFRFQKYEPSRSYIESFGNMTKYGLLDNKRQEWKCDVTTNSRERLKSQYKDTFLPPKNEDYQQCRLATKKKNSSKVNHLYRESLNLNFRGKPILNMPAHFDMVKVVKPLTLSPITWECQPRVYK